MIPLAMPRPQTSNGKPLIPTLQQPFSVHSRGSLSAVKGNAEPRRQMTHHCKCSCWCGRAMEIQYSTSPDYLQDQLYMYWGSEHTRAAGFRGLRPSTPTHPKAFCACSPVHMASNLILLPVGRESSTARVLMLKMNGMTANDNVRLGRTTTKVSAKRLPNYHRFSEGNGHSVTATPRSVQFQQMQAQRHMLSAYQTSPSDCIQVENMKVCRLSHVPRHTI